MTCRQGKQYAEINASYVQGGKFTPDEYAERAEVGGAAFWLVVEIHEALENIGRSAGSPQEGDKDET